MAKSSKGTVVVYEADGRLRLRWSHFDALNRKKRFSLAFGSINQTNRMAAERLAKQIELDIASGNFDPSLNKYRSGVDRTDLTIAQLVERYLSSEISEAQGSSRERYRVLKTHLISCFSETPADRIDERLAKRFYGFLEGRGLKGETINMYLTLVRAIWKWGIKRGHVQTDPWGNLAAPIEPHPLPDPFTREEVAAILQGFEGNHYHDFVRFLLGTGCRIGEAIALNWDAIGEDCSEIWIGRSWDATTRTVKSTKNRRARSIPVSPGIQAMLQTRKESRNGDIVFPAQGGDRIDRRNFLRRHWKPTLEAAGVPYRPPYNSRHTRWSHELADGLDVAIASQYAGNRPRTMLGRYYGATKRPRLKDWD